MSIVPVATMAPLNKILIPMPYYDDVSRHPPPPPPQAIAAYDGRVIVYQQVHPIPVTVSAPPVPPHSMVPVPVHEVTPQYESAEQVLSTPVSPSPASEISITMQMELVWHSQFNYWFRKFYPDAWLLYPTTKPPDELWKSYRDSAKVRFCCQQCGRGWTSMKGRVEFWFDLSGSEGQVHFKLFGQQCNRCENGSFEHAMWYPEEVIKVIGNIYSTVGQAYYNFQAPPLYQYRRAGKPQTEHNKALCQACSEGFCAVLSELSQ